MFPFYRWNTTKAWRGCLHSAVCIAIVIIEFCVVSISTVRLQKVTSLGIDQNRPPERIKNPKLIHV